MTVLEAEDHIGGRSVDEGSLKFNPQSHMVVGCYNNPIVILCKQVKLVSIFMSSFLEVGAFRFALVHQSV